MAHCLKRIIEGLEEFSKPSQLQGLTDSVRNGGKDDLPTIITLAIALSSQKSPEPCTGHVFQFAHIDNKFVFASIIRGLECLRQLLSRGAIHPPFDGNHVAMFELLNRYVHRTPPVECTVLTSKIIS